MEETRTELATQDTEFLPLKSEFVVVESTDDDFAYSFLEDATAPA